MKKRKLLLRLLHSVTNHDILKMVSLPRKLWREEDGRRNRSRGSGDFGLRGPKMGYFGPEEKMFASCFREFGSELKKVGFQVQLSAESVIIIHLSSF